jgi:protein TonB
LNHVVKLDANILERPVVSAVRRRSRLFWWAVAASVIAHLLAAAGALVLLPRLVPADKPPSGDGAVELLIEEKKGSEGGNPGDRQQQDQKPAPEQPEAKAVPSQAMLETPDRSEVAVPSVQTGTEAQKPNPPAAEARSGLTMDLSGTDSQADWLASGEKIVPASVDNRFRNRPPDYPNDAAARGEHGTVVLMIHVSENGIPRAIEVIRSSGYRSLDDAAIRGIKKWHFRPALRDGRPEAFDMPFSIIFEEH